MIELARYDYPVVEKLLAALDQPVLPRAVLEGTARGWIFADRVENPTWVLLGLPCGYFFGAGRAPRGAGLAGARAAVVENMIPRSRQCGNFGFLFSFSGADWADELPELLPGRRPVQIYRRTFGFDAERFAGVEDNLPPLPDGLRLREIDADLLAVQPLLRDEILGTWPAQEDFLSTGCGAAVLYGGEAVSFCFSPFATHSAMEISVATAEPYRRRGLGRQAAAAFIRGCLARGKHPNWECFWDNQPSIALAETLGYTARKDYPIFYWEEGNPQVEQAIP